MVHRRLEPWTRDQKVLTIQGSCCVSSFLWHFMTSIFASLLVPLISSPLYCQSGFCCFSVHMAQNGCPTAASSASVWDKQTLDQHSRIPVFIPWEKVWWSCLASGDSPALVGGDGSGARRIMCRKYGCQNPWELQFLEHGVWGIDIISGVPAMKILKIYLWMRYLRGRRHWNISLWGCEGFL